MIADRDTDRLLSSWFKEPSAPLPDHVLDAVMDGLPRVRQRRRSGPTFEIQAKHRTWLRIGVVAATLIALLAGLVLAGTGAIFPPRPRAFVIGLSLAPGRYVVDDPWPVRFAFDIPLGWVGTEHTADTVALARDEATSAAGLHVLFVDAVYLTPCHPEEGLRDRVGPTPEDLASAIGATPDIGTVDLGRAAVGGLPASVATVLPPDRFSGCESETELKLFGLPHDYTLVAGMRHRFWILTIDGQRIVIAGRDAGPGSEAAMDIDRVVASIELGVAPVGHIPIGSAGPAPNESPLPTMPAAGPVDAGIYRFPVSILAPTTEGAFEALHGAYEGTVEVPAAWTRTARGLASGPREPADASFAVWTIATVYRDPCHWQASPLGPIDASTLSGVDALAGALTHWWPPVPDPDVVPAGYEPPDGAPLASRAILQPWNSRAARELWLDVPPDLDLGACDGGQYRLWLDPAGDPRTAQPGEHVHLLLIDFAPAVVAVNLGLVDTGNAALEQDLGTMMFSLWIGQPLVPSRGP